MKISLPKKTITLEQVKQYNKKVLTDNFEKEGILAKILVFVKMNEPVSNDELRNLLYDYYSVEFDKNKIKDCTKRLAELGMLNSITSGDLMATSASERNEMLEIAYKKFFEYLEHIPKQFKKNYNRVNYYWIPNGQGNEYVEWACKILGFGVENDK